MAKAAADMRFYVYELIDPRDGSVFYVGKGMGCRVDSHEREAVRGVDTEKCRRIRDIIGAGLSVEKWIVRKFHNESAAYRFERARIKKIGLANLTNVSAGGRAPSYDQNAYTDRQSVRIAARFIQRVCSFGTDKIEFVFGGERIPMPADLVSVAEQIIRDMVKKRGGDWTERALRTGA